MKPSVKVYLNPMSKPMVQLSVVNFNFVKPGLIKHVFVGVNGALVYTYTPNKLAHGRLKNQQNLDDGLNPFRTLGN